MNASRKAILRILLTLLLLSCTETVFAAQRNNDRLSDNQKYITRQTTFNNLTDWWAMRGRLKNDQTVIISKRKEQRRLGRLKKFKDRQQEELIKRKKEEERANKKLKSRVP